MAEADRPIPQWITEAAREIADHDYYDESVPEMVEIIARHAQPEMERAKSFENAYHGALDNMKQAETDAREAEVAMREARQALRLLSTDQGLAAVVTQRGWPLPEALIAARAEIERLRAKVGDHDSARQAEKERADYAESELKSAWRSSATRWSAWWR